MIYHVYDVVTLSMLLIKLSMALLKIAFLVLRDGFMSINLPMTSSRNVLECCSENFTFDSETITAGD